MIKLLFWPLLIKTFNLRRIWEWFIFTLTLITNKIFWASSCVFKKKWRALNHQEFKGKDARIRFQFAICGKVLNSNNYFRAKNKCKRHSKAFFSTHLSLQIIFRIITNKCNRRQLSIRNSKTSLWTFYIFEQASLQRKI